jgi:SAM-dependent MidA family methyltransferase
MTNLREMLKEEMAREGVISFATFMERALYCPKIGYYERTAVSPGRKGDFYTSVSVGPLFGELLAAQFKEWLQPQFDAPKRGEMVLPLPGGEGRGEGGCSTEISFAEWGKGGCQIVEAGAHDGKLAADILRHLKTTEPEVFGRLEYWILEPSASRRESQQTTLAEFAGKLRWFESWNDLPADGVRGVIFSNELLDAMPVHRLGWDAAKREWFEWGVTLRGGEFAWSKLPNAPAFQFLQHATRNTQHAMALLPQALLDILPDGFTTEVCPSAIEWWRNAARALKAGKLLTFDYGLAAEQFFTPERKDGTLRAYYRHHASNDLLAHPGEQDLTAQVNFTAITAAGEAEGLKTEAFTSQGQFLVGIVEKGGSGNSVVKEWTPSRVRQFQTLTHPEHLGRAFKVLVQGSERSQSFNSE